MYLMIDNYDSFVYNLGCYLRDLVEAGRKAEVLVGAEIQDVRNLPEFLGLDGTRKKLAF